MKHNILIILLFLSYSISANTLPSAITDTVIVQEKVSYKYTNNPNNIHLNISTSDEKTILSILHLGISVYFDIKGKKKQNVFVKYPSEPLKPQRKRGEKQQQEPQSFEEEAKNKIQRIKEIIENNYSQKALYVYFDDSEEFNILLNTLEINISLKFDETNGILAYDLHIPKSLINTDSKKSLEKLTVGIKTVKEKVKQHSENNLSGLSMGNQRGGGRQGGGQGGPPGGGRQGSQRGGSPNEKATNSPTEVMLDFWFEANL